MRKLGPRTTSLNEGNGLRTLDNEFTPLPYTAASFVLAGSKLPPDGKAGRELGSDAITALLRPFVRHLSVPTIAWVLCMFMTTGMFGERNAPSIG